MFMRNYKILFNFLETFSILSAFDNPKVILSFLLPQKSIIIINICKFQNEYTQEPESRKKALTKILFF